MSCSRNGSRRLDTSTIFAKVEGRLWAALFIWSGRLLDFLRHIADFKKMEANAEYHVRDNVERHRFEIDLDDGTTAFAAYNLLSGQIMFTHTEVPPEHEGKGIGTALIRSSLASARERQLKVIPICPFFAAYMQKHQEEQDLLEASWRARFGLPVD